MKQEFIFYHLLLGLNCLLHLLLVIVGICRLLVGDWTGIGSIGTSLPMLALLAWAWRGLARVHAKRNQLFESYLKEIDDDLD